MPINIPVNKEEDKAGTDVKINRWMFDLSFEQLLMVVEHERMHDFFSKKYFGKSLMDKDVYNLAVDLLINRTLKGEGHVKNDA